MIPDNGVELMAGVFVSVVTYELTVTTGELWNAGTDAVISLTIFGETGDTGSRQLRSSRNHQKMFCAGQVTLFLTAMK